MKNSLLVRFFVLASVVFGVQPEIFSGSSSAPQKQSAAQRAKGYLMNLFSLKSSRSNAKAEIKPIQYQEIAKATAAASFRAPKSPVLAPHESGLKYLEQSQARKQQEANRLSILSPPNEHSRFGSMEDELARTLRPSRAERLAERNRFGGGSSPAKSADSAPRASSWVSELPASARQVPPRPARPPLPSQPKRPVRQQ